MADLDYDIVIVGAGISGINFAYRLQQEHPEMSFCILEGRHELGGTWSLFKYPGLRSDSDLYTFGFQWNPWLRKEAIATGPRILEYLHQSVDKAQLGDKFRFRHEVERMSWDSASATWTVDLNRPAGAGTDPEKREAATLRSRFVFLGTGYYDYNTPLATEIPGIDRFAGDVIHPQFWPEDYDYTGKRVVIIGSGATAVTLLPNLTDRAEHVTMLQRSPGYVVSRAGTSLDERFVKSWLPAWLGYRYIRAKWIMLSLFMVKFCAWFPARARRRAIIAAQAQLPPGMSVDPHFTPAYNPWDQRVCLSPDGDFYACLREGKASVVTDHIDTVTENSIRLKSGAELNPDLIVTATGLKLRLAGGIDVVVDGKPFDMASRFAWKTSMIEDLPNAFLVWGYVNASWTLGADTTSFLACRLFTAMKKRGVRAIAPRRVTEQERNMSKLPILDLKATYVRKGLSNIPSCGDLPQWQPRTHYLQDLARATIGDLETGLEWIK